MIALTLILASTIAAFAPTEMVVTPREEMRFIPLVANAPDGPAMAVLSGDPASGPSEMLLRMPGGAGVPHIHSAAYSLVIIEGRMTHSAHPSAEAREAMGPGSYWFQPGGEAHVDSCLDDQCLVYIRWSGPRDARRWP